MSSVAQSVLSPFGHLLAEIREERDAERAPAVRIAAPESRRSGPEPELNIETRVVSGPPPSGQRATGWLWPASALFHAALILCVVVIPLMLSETLPAPAAGTRAFFVGPPSIALPPPPPPPAAASAPRSAARPKVPPTPAPAAFTAPLDVPEPPVAEGAAESGAGVPGVAGGEAGGVAGGVPGGIAGGVIGGAPGPEAPPAIVRVGGEVREPKKLRHVDPVYPDVAVAAKIRGIVVLDCVVSTQGHVTDVSIVRGIPLLNAAAIDAVRQWTYTPTLKDGVPVRVLLTVTVRFDL